ncbi:hypothetical protein CC78DRAFT_595439 [Lojkania enalia]|uniref:Uncharacterized protein n=1 Tax=Lojkania enalia TaxID=147567 RepID=A0A9P4JYV1_9PLEO|nr:hypothetical protein CC78DRAFT_595439 [Didymosphaeria enalia]
MQGSLGRDPALEEKQVAATGSIPVVSGKEVVYPQFPEYVTANRDVRNLPQVVDSGATPATPAAESKTYIFGLKKRTIWVIAIAILVAIGALAGGIAGGLASRSTGTSAPATTPTTTSASATATAVKKSTFETISAPAPYPSSLSADNLIKNAEFNNGMQDWTLEIDNNPQLCWASADNPSGNSDDTETIARIYNDRDGIPCSMNQTVEGAGAGDYTLAFLYGTYWNSSAEAEPGYLVVQAGGASSGVMLFNVSYTTPGRYDGFVTAAYKITIYENDFLIEFRAWSERSVWDIAKVQLTKD